MGVFSYSVGCQVFRNQNNYFRPKSVKNYLNNSQNHFRSVNWPSVVLHSQIQQTLCKPEITQIFQGGSKLVIYYLTNCWKNNLYLSECFRRTRIGFEKSAVIQESVSAKLCCVLWVCFVSVLKTSQDSNSYQAICIGSLVGNPRKIQSNLRRNPSELGWHICRVKLATRIFWMLRVELFYLQLTIIAFLLAIWAFSLTILAFLLTIGASLLSMWKRV